MFPGKCDQTRQELSAHRLIAVTHVSNPGKGHCTNYYRFLWHPWIQTAEDGDFRLVVREEQASFLTVDCARSPSEPQNTNPCELEDTSPGEPQITPLVIPSSPKENNNKRISYRGKVSVTSSITSFPKLSSAASPPGKVLSDATKIILERRIGELRTQIVATLKKGNHIKASQLHCELSAHQTALGFTPDDSPATPKAPRKEESHDSTTVSHWSSPEEVRRSFDELRRSLGWPIKR